MSMNCQGSTLLSMNPPNNQNWASYPPVKPAVSPCPPPNSTSGCGFNDNRSKKVNFDDVNVRATSGKGQSQSHDRMQPITMHVTVKPNNENENGKDALMEDCCTGARELDTLKKMTEELSGQDLDSMDPLDEVGLSESKLREDSSSQRCKEIAKDLCSADLPPYPCHGVIAPDNPMYTRAVENIKKRCKELAEKDERFAALLKNAERDVSMTGREFTEGLRTTDIYPVDENLPERFKNPEWFRGYGCETNPGHPFYLTTNSEYGRFPPTAHTMTQTYWPKSTKFTEKLARTGMPRNRSLNLASTKTYI